MQSKAAPLRTEVLVLLLCAGAAVAMTWPLAGHLGTHTMGEKFLRSYYLYWHMATYGPSEWLVATYRDVYFPEGGSGVTNGVPLYVLGALLRPMLGNLAAINTAILLHLAFGAYGAFRLSRAWWIDKKLPLAAHISAGLGFGFCGHALSVYENGQPENLGLGYVALCVEAALHYRRKGQTGWLLTCIVSYAFAFLMTPYLAMALILCGWALLLGTPIRRAAGLIGGLGAATALLGAHFSRALGGGDSQLFCPSPLQLYPDAQRMLPLTNLGGLMQPFPEGPSHLSLDLIYLLRPTTLLADINRSHHTYNGHLGLVLLIFVAVALWRRSPGAGRLLAAAALPLVLGLGRTLYMHGWAPTVQGMALGLPLGWLQDAPGIGAAFRTIQFPGRLVVGALLPLWLLGAVGLARLGTGRPALLWVLAFAPALAQRLALPADIHQLNRHALRGAHQALAAQPDHLAVADIPPFGFEQGLIQGPNGAPLGPPIQLAARQVRDSTEHHHPVPYRVGCYSELEHPAVVATGLSTAIQRQMAALDGADSRSDAAIADAAARLQALGFGWVVVLGDTGWTTPEQEDRLVESLSRVLVLETAAPDRSWLFSIPAARPQPPAPAQAPPTVNPPGAPSPVAPRR